MPLRRYQPSDADTLVTAIRESVNGLRPWMPWCHAGYDAEEARGWLARQVAGFDDGEAFEFAIVDDDGHYLGACGVNRIDRLNRRANLGYWVRTGTTGRGVATTAVQALRDWAFANTDLVRLEIVVALGNHGSRRVALKAGARLEGTLRQRLVLDGTPRDAELFAITRD